MKSIDAKSLAVAAAIGGALFYGWWYYRKLDGLGLPASEIIATGAFFGAGLQLFIRLLGVS